MKKTKQYILNFISCMLTSIFQGYKTKSITNIFCRLHSVCQVHCNGCRSPTQGFHDIEYAHIKAHIFVIFCSVFEYAKRMHHYAYTNSCEVCVETLFQGQVGSSVARKHNVKCGIAQSFYCGGFNYINQEIRL